MSISNNKQEFFLTKVAQLMELSPCHPFYKGLEGIPLLEKPCFEEIRNPYDVFSSTYNGTVCDNDITYRDLAIYEMFRKAKFDLDGVDPTVNAKTAFIEQMSHAEMCNSRLTQVLSIPLDHELWSNVNYAAFRRVLRFSQYYCSVLTSYAESVFVNGLIEPRFTDGSIQTSGNDLKKGNSPIERYSKAAVSKDVSALCKIVGDMHNTRMPNERSEMPFWASFCKRARVIDGPDKMNFVQKTYKIDRDTTKSFVGDAAIQSGIGDVLSESLKRNGYDISTLPDTHKELARIGSLTGQTSTFDMKGGSNNVFLSLGKYLLSPFMYDLLISARNNRLAIDDESEIKLPIMATAGNGFCFPLETIIFLSLQMGVCANLGLKPQIKRNRSANGSYQYIRKSSYHKVCSTFGDDVIIPTYAAKLFINFFDKLGIILNLDKSFYTGSFRESCGGHYENGHDVNCFNSKSVPTMDNANEIKKFLNGVRAFGYDNNHGRWRHPSLKSLWYGVARQCRGLIFNQGTNGDGGVLVPRSYSVIRYWSTVDKSLFRYNVSATYRVSAHSCLRVIAKTRYSENIPLVLTNVYVPKGAGGYPIVEQKFTSTRFTDKVGLPLHLRKNPVHSLPLLQIAGQGLLSGAGITGMVDLLCVNKADAPLESVQRDSNVSPYPEHFIVNRLKTQETVSHRDSYSMDYESVDDLFNRVGDIFQRTRIARIKRDYYANTRRALWETKRDAYLIKLISVLRNKSNADDKIIIDLFE